MRRHILLSVGLAAALAVGIAPPTAAGTGIGTATATGIATAGVAPSAVAVHRPAGLDPRVITTFPDGADGAFAESMVVDRAGTLYVSVTTWSAAGWNSGQIWKITPNGRRTRFGPAIPSGLLTGLALDRSGRLYVGLAAWEEPGLPTVAPGVVRVNVNGTVTRVLTLPNGPSDTASFPNGLAFRGDDLYVSDSTGSIWRTRPRGTVNDTPRSPWLRNSILAPTVGHFGVNGIAFRANALYAAVYDAGLIVKIPIGRTGRAGTPIVVARNAALKDADGIMFDTAGTLWVTSTRSAVVGSGALLTVSRTGKVTVVAEDPAWLDYPTQAVFGRTAHDHHTLYITNGSFDADGPSNVTAIHVRTPWVHPM